MKVSAIFRGFLTATVVSVLFFCNEPAQKPTTQHSIDTAALWYKNCFIYTLDIEVFQDSDGDGTGDIRGLISRLDHIKGLGADAIWLAPFQPTPNQDDGYGITDHYGIDARLGTTQDFDLLVIRALVVYLIIIVALRIMGKRMGKLLTRNELAAVSTLAAAIGIPLQTPDRGLLPGLLIAAIVVILQRTIAGIGSRNERFERLTQGSISTLVSNSVLQLDAMKETHLSREHIFSKLRGSSIRHLGEVERLYLEANGSFTLITETTPSPGLCVLPEKDTAFISEQVAHTDKQVCKYCGLQKGERDTCGNCESKEWVNAVS